MAMKIKRMNNNYAWAKCSLCKNTVKFEGPNSANICPGCGQGYKLTNDIVRPVAREAVVKVLRERNLGRNLLCKFKTAKNLTWPQVAEALGTPLRTVEDWASGRSRVPPATIKLLGILLAPKKNIPKNERTQLYVRRLISGDVLVEFWKGQALVSSHKLGRLTQEEYREMAGEVARMSKIIGSRFGIAEEGQS